MPRPCAWFKLKYGVNEVRGYITAMLQIEFGILLNK